MSHLSLQIGLAVVVRNAITRNENVIHQNLHGKNDRNPSCVPNAVNLVSIRGHELHQPLVDQTLVAYQDHSARRRRLPHPKISISLLPGLLDFCRDGT